MASLAVPRHWLGTGNTGLGMVCSAPLAHFAACIDARAPVRLDGELVRADGAGANWRELRAGRPELALKTASRVLLSARADFIGAAR